jgi:hypothetical protein
MTLPQIIQDNQLKPTYISQSQLYLLVSFIVLLRHNLFLLQNYRNDYVVSFRQRLNYLPQGLGNAPSNAARDRFLDLAGEILEQMMNHSADGPGEPVQRTPCAFLPNQLDSSTSLVALPSSSTSSDHHDACQAISTLVCYLQDSSTARSQYCDVSDICKAAINQCQPLLKVQLNSLFLSLSVQNFITL